MSPIGACNLLIYNQHLYLVYSEFFHWAGCTCSHLQIKIQMSLNNKDNIRKQ